MSHHETETLGSIVGTNLKRLMTAKGFSPEDLAGQEPKSVQGPDGKPGPSLGASKKKVDAKTIRRILNGESATPQPSTITSIAAALGIPVEALTTPPRSVVDDEDFPDEPVDDLVGMTDPEIEDLLFGEPSREKVSLTRITRVRDLEAFFGKDDPSVQKLFSTHLTEEDEDWAAELMDVVVVSSREFSRRYHRDGSFGEVAKRALLKTVLAKIHERFELCVSLGNGNHRYTDSEGEPRTSRVLIVAIAPEAIPLTSCLY